MRGYCATGRKNSAIPPISVMTTDNTVAKTGRSMKNREIIGEFSLVRRPGLAGRAEVGLSRGIVLPPPLRPACAATAWALPRA